MKQSTHRPWTEPELHELRRAYDAVAGSELNLETLARRLGRDKANVCRKARSLGLTNPRRPKRTQPQLFLHGPRFTPEEAAARQAESRRTRWHRQPHPRGMAGKRHSPATLARLGAASRSKWQTVTADQVGERSAKAIRTRLERFGTGNTALRSPNAYSRAKRGRREDLGGRFFRSAWEANIARSLELERQRGGVREWQYEPRTFVFRGRRRRPFSYTPDFRVVMADGFEMFYEVKGWWTRADQLKVTLFERHYGRQHFLHIVGPDDYRWIERTHSPAIPAWEGAAVR